MTSIPFSVPRHGASDCEGKAPSTGRPSAALSAAAPPWPSAERLFDDNPLADSIRGEDGELSRLLSKVEAFSRSASKDQQELFKFRELLLEAAQSVFMRWKVLTQLQSMALTDDLTGLYNRRGFLLLGMQTLRLAARSAQSLHLFFVDVDCLKQINDRYGHFQGDAFLVGCAEALNMTFRESDIIARIGGDEFAILAQGGSDESRDAVLARLESSLRLMNRDVLSPHKLSLSVGVARFDSANPITLAELLTIADREMFDQKRKSHTANPDSFQSSNGIATGHADIAPATDPAVLHRA